jgi:hypothetical protein
MKTVPAAPAPKTDVDGEHLHRVRRICLALPGATEKLSHGEPTFFVNKKVFAMFSDNHHNDGHIAILIPAAPGAQPALIKDNPKTYYRPAYVGVRGWIGIELKNIGDEELSAHIHEAWQMIAPKKLQARHVDPGAIAGVFGREAKNVLPQNKIRSLR